MISFEKLEINARIDVVILVSISKPVVIHVICITIMNIAVATATAADGIVIMLVMMS